MTKKRGSILSFLLILFILSAAVTPAWADTEESAAVDMEISAGFQDSYKVNSWVPFRITLQSKGEGFQGDVQIIPNTSVPQQLAYASPVDLPANSKKVVEIDVFTNMINKKMIVQLVKNHEKVLEKEVEFSKTFSPNVSFIGVLSDQPAGLNYLSGLRPFEAVREGMELIPLTGKTFPQDQKIMENFDIVVINNFDTSTLSEEQKGTLSEWVKEGGMLVLGMGPNYKKVINTLPDELRSVDIQGNLLLDDRAALEKYASKNFLGSDKLAITTMSVKRGITLVTAGSHPLIVNEKIGEGTVVTMAFDPALQPVADWAGNQAMWKNVITATPGTYAGQRVQQVTMGYPVGKYSMHYFGNSNIPPSEMPSIWWIMVILVVYIILVGPVSYIVLKKKDKRDWMWVTVPVISVIFVGSIFLMGFKTRFVSPIVTSSTMVKIAGDTMKASVTSGMYVTTPFKGDMKLTFQEGTELTPAGDYGGPYYGPPSKPDEKPKNPKVVARLVSSGAEAIEYLNMQTWGSRNFTANQEFFLPGGIFTDILVDRDALVIKINNKTGYGYNDAFLKIGSNYIDLGDIKIDDEREVRVEIDSSLRTDFYSLLNKKFGQNMGRQPGQQITKEQQDNFRKRQVYESNYNIVREINADRSSEAVFFAWNRDPLGYEIRSENKPVKFYNTNVVVMTVPYHFRKTGEIRILPGFIKASNVAGADPINAKMAMSRQPGGEAVIIRNDGDVVFNFQIPQYVKPQKVQILWNSDVMPGYGKPAGSGQQPSTNAKLFIQNVDSRGWEEISDTHTIDKNFEKYITADGQISVKAEVKIDKQRYPEAFVRYPDIDISGVENNAGN